jgi:hypothetical protein
MMRRTGVMAAVLAGATLLAVLPTTSLASDAPAAAPAKTAGGGETLKEDVKEVGHSIGKTAKKVGHETEKGVRKAARATAHGVEKAAHGVEHAAEKTESKLDRSEAASKNSPK